MLPNYYRHHSSVRTADTPLRPSPIWILTHMITHGTNVRQMKRKINVLMDTFKLKQKINHDRLFLMTIKSYAKKEWKTTDHFLKNVHELKYMKCCKEMREWRFPQNDWTYTFRNREFKIRNILDSFCVNTPKTCSMVLKHIEIKKK